MMKKILSDYNVKTTLDKEYINELKSLPELSMYDINEDNYIDFSNMINSINNCKNCKGLHECKNLSDGFVNDCIIEGGKYYFTTKPCKYKIDLKREAASQKHLNTLYISKNVLNAKLEDYRLTSETRIKAFNYVKKFACEFSESNYMKGLCLCGPCGCGKTYLLSCLANELAKNSISSLLIYVPDLIRDLKNSLGTSRLEETMNMLKTVPVLILDDLGSEMMTQWVRDEIISPLLNYRMMDEKPVFISTNLSMKALHDHFASTNVDEDNTKATRIMTRLQNLVYVLKYDE